MVGYLGLVLNSTDCGYDFEGAVEGVAVVGVSVWLAFSLYDTVLLSHKARLSNIL